MDDVIMDDEILILSNLQDVYKDKEILLQSMEKIIQLFKLKVGIYGNGTEIDRDMIGCVGVRCDKCPFNDDRPNCSMFYVLPKKVKLRDLIAVYRYIQNGYREIKTIDINDVIA